MYVKDVVEAEFVGESMPSEYKKNRGHESENAPNPFIDKTLPHSKEI